MKRLRAVPGVSDALSAYRASPRSSRQLSTALLRKPTPQSPSPTPLVPALQRLPIPSIPQNRQYAQKSEAPTETKKTPLYDLHVANGGKMVPFGGFSMPVQYASLSVSASHHFTRSHASLFDVSHMVQHMFSGPGAAAFLETVMPASVSALAEMSGGLSALLHRGTGGIVDDTIITKLGEGRFYVVTNAACREKDLGYLEKEIKAFREVNGDTFSWDVLDDKALLALQGPLSAEILGGLVVDAEGKELDMKKWYFGQSRHVKLLDGKVPSSLLVSRGGYTGEDGFEISVNATEAVALTEIFLQSAEKDKLQLAGLGARDSLRLEAGMCLYGHDLDDSTTPVEGGLSWIIGKDRRASGGFHGSETILKQLTPKSKGGQGVDRRRVGLIVEGAPAREGAEIVNEEGKKIGNITSGCPSPTLGKNIAMGYIKDGFHKSGTNVEVVVRGKKRKAQVTKMPFVPSKYWKGAAPA